MKLRRLALGWRALGRLAIMGLLSLFLLMLGACHAPGPRALHFPASVNNLGDRHSSELAHAPIIRGRIQFTAPRRIGALLSSVIASASITLADRYGNAITSSLTDGAGAFTLAPSGFIPAVGRVYLLEASKGLDTGSVGKATARFRSLIQWSGSGWLSITGATESVPIVLNPLTTAVAFVAALDPANVSLEQTMGKINAGITPATVNPVPTFVNHPDAEITALASSLVGYLEADFDPTATLTGLRPEISGLGASGTGVGELIAIYGTGFVPGLGSNTVLFGVATASIQLATSRQLIVLVPVDAISGSITVRTSFGTSAGMPIAIGRVSIVIDPAGYGGAWAIPGVTSDWHRERRQVWLTLGRSYQLQISGQNDVAFAVDVAGNLTVQSGPATAGAGRLTLQSVPVSINVGGIAHSWAVSNTTDWLAGNATVTLLRNSSFSLAVSGASAPIAFTIDGAGNVTPGGAAATGGAGALNLSTEAITVEPSGLKANWRVDGDSWRSGRQALRAMRDRSYTLFVAGISGGIPFQIAATGALSSTDTRATTAGSTLTLATAPVTIQPNGIIASWYVDNVTSWLSLSQTVTLLKGAIYTLRLGIGNTPILFAVDAAGVVTTSSQSATGGPNRLDFRTQFVTINRNGYLGTWAVKDYLVSDRLVPDTGLMLVKGQTYVLHPRFIWWGDTGPSVNFSVDGAGQVIVYHPLITGGLGLITFATTAITINPNAWGGGGGLYQWYMQGGVVPYWVAGPQTLTLLKGFSYDIYPMFRFSQRFSFYVDNTGNVDSQASHVGGLQTLNFNTVTTTISTAATARWYIGELSRTHNGNGSATLIRGLSYQLIQSDGAVQPFTLNGAGAASPNAFSLNGVSYTLSP